MNAEDIISLEKLTQKAQQCLDELSTIQVSEEINEYLFHRGIYLQTEITRLMKQIENILQRNNHRIL